MTSAYVLSAETLHHNELPLEPHWYGAIALLGFLALLGLLWSFRNTLALDAHGEAGTDAAASPDSGRGSRH